MSLRHPTAVFLLMIMAMAMVWSKALLGITMGLLAIHAVFDIQWRPFSIRWTLTPSFIRRSLKTHSYIWSFTLLAFLYLLSIIYAGDIGSWWKLTHMKLAFLLIPVSFALTGPYSRRDYMLIVVCMIITAVWSTILVQIAYFSRFDLFSRSIGFGHSLPTPINHIRYSVVIAVSMIACIGFYVQRWTIKYTWERIAYGIAGVYLFYFLHVLSVRSGLVVGYLGVLVLIIYYLRKITLWKKLALVACVILAPVIAYKTMPGFELKVHYTLYDLGMYKTGQGESYSDSERWQSWQAGLAVGNRHPFIGTGPGRFEKEMKAYYFEELKADNWTRPHNQWINIFAMLGIAGVLVLLFVIIFPMTFSHFWKIPFFASIYIMQVATMMVEHPLDTQFGTSLFLMMSLLALRTEDNAESSL